MGILASQLRLYVIRPTLQKLDLWSDSAENLLLATAAQESKLGTYLHQENGPALGIYQIEPATHKDVWDNFLKFQPDLKAYINSICFLPCDDELISNLSYATAIARIIYFRINEPLPAADDVAGLARYWKTHYNTGLGVGSEEEFIKNYNELILNA